MASGTEKLADIMRDIEPLLARMQNLTELEKYKVTAAAFLGSHVKIGALVEARNESTRRAQSTAFKDIFQRIFDPGYTDVSPQDKKIMGRVAERVAEDYHKRVKEFSALLEEEARMKAEIENAPRKKAEAEAALARKRAEIEKMAAAASVLDKDMPVSKPMNVVKRNTSRVP